MTPPFLPGHHCDENYHGEVVYEYDTNNEDDEAGVIGNSHSRPFPRMKASDSLCRIMGMDFFIPFRFPNFGNVFFSFPSRSQIMGMFFHFLPVPELWEWIFFIPFPLPNLLFHRRESKRELDYCKRYQASNFFSFLYISQNNYIEEVNEPRCSKVSD